MAYLAGEAERRLGPIDGWINNAGLARHRAIADYSEDEIDSMLAVNLKGTILGSQAALRTMAPRRRGHIVNIISTAALRGIPSETVYCATKWGVRGFTQGLREEAAPSNIRVSAVLPGGVDTAFWQHALPGQVMPLDTFGTALGKSASRWLVFLTSSIRENVDHHRTQRRVLHCAGSVWSRVGSI